MKYYHSKKLENVSYEDATQRIKDVLKEAGFGVLTEIDIQATLKEKINKDFRPYKILGACNPELAYRALQVEDKIGTMLPCNVIVQQLDGSVEVAAVDPAASMQAVENEPLKNLAIEVQNKLKSVIDKL